MPEIVVIGESGHPVKVDAHEYAKKIKASVVIDNGDGTSTHYTPNGKTKTEKGERED